MNPTPAGPADIDATPEAPSPRPVAALWADLLSAALVGTARRPAAPADLALLLGSDRRSPVRNAGTEVRRPEAGADAGDAAGDLLAAAAVLAAYRRAGTRAGEAPRVLPAAAEPDGRPICSQAALDVLELILSGEVPIPGGVALLAGQWLDGAARRQCRLPARLLPRLLDVGSVAAPLQPSLRVVAGPRGRWLAAHHGRWSWAAAEPLDGGEETERRFATAARADRPVVLEAVRRVDPARGRDLLATTWKSDPAAERAALLTVLATGLSDDDEPFLEAALDDRAGGVRQVANDLLARLPSSRRAARMADRLRPLVSVTAAPHPSLVVARPPNPDAAERRDGINDAAPSGTGVVAWRTLQLVAGAPLSFWTGHLGLTPEEVVALAASAGETSFRRQASTAGPILLGLEQAIAAQCRPRDAGTASPPKGLGEPAADLAWATALFSYRPTPLALEALPAGRAAEALTGLVAQGSALAPGVAVAQLMAAVPGPWPAALGEAVLDRYRQLGGKAALTELPAALPVLAERLDPSALPLVETWAFALPGEQGLRRRVQTLGHALSLRAVIQREFP